MTNVVVVESPAKAKTIERYLGGGYTVLASFGHVRDLPPKDGSVRPDADFEMDWESDARGDRQVGAIVKALKGAKTLYLATDPDREGEAISWHVRAMLADKHALKGVDVRRITFNEITRNAIRYAIAHPRDLDQPLIEAYLARRALDYLVGFTLSPVLWRKLPGSRSAGRVQSVALRLVCDREAEIEVFKTREYWTIETVFTTPAGAPFTARLTHLDGKRLDQFDLNNETLALRAKTAVEAGTFTVGSVERKRVKRNPPPPFTTSTLQQEASRKLGFGAQQTMRLAQQLYEGIDIGGETTGLITYMRTDGVQMAREAIFGIRDHVKGAYGPDYLPAAPREYTSKAKNAQEAHEAIRATDVGRTPDSVARGLNNEQRRLYELIWKRAVASQMQSAELDQVSVEVTDSKGLKLRATGSIVAFDGFLKLYREDTDDAAEGASAEDDNRMLPPMAERDPLRRGDVNALQHFTQPPPRYSEASLVKKMEELGIGRPSTYASILSVLQDRKYVRLDKRRFIPEDRGRLVTAFLVSFFEHYVDTGFTAGLEEKLDEISAGTLEWRSVMRAFWAEFSKAVEPTRELKISDVISALDEDLGPHFFPPRDDGGDPRVCAACGNGRLGLKLGRYGSFIGCSNYPACQYTRRLAIDTGDDQGETLKEGMRSLGHHPDTGEEITVRRGPYGLYVQQGENTEDKKARPKRTSLPRGMDGDQITLAQALGLLSLPREIGTHPETKEKIEAGIGRFGPYVKMGAVFGSLDKDDDVLALGLNRAVDLLAKKMASVRTIGNHPGDKEIVSVRKGRFGPYVQHGKTVANLPRGVMMEDVTLDEAVALLVEKGKALKPRGAAGKKGRGGAAKGGVAENGSQTNGTQTRATRKTPPKMAAASARTAPDRPLAAHLPERRRDLRAKAPRKRRPHRKRPAAAGRLQPRPWCPGGQPNRSSGGADASRAARHGRPRASHLPTAMGSSRTRYYRRCARCGATTAYPDVHEDTPGHDG
jgi:DNA topoisomerase I